MRCELFMKVENDELLMFDESTDYMKPISDIDSKKWLKATKSEMNFMYTNKVWTLVDLPKRIKPIVYKCVFKIKTDMDSNVQTYKARLVIKGYRKDK